MMFLDHIVECWDVGTDLKRALCNNASVKGNCNTFNNHNQFNWLLLGNDFLTGLEFYSVLVPLNSEVAFLCSMSVELVVLFVKSFIMSVGIPVHPLWGLPQYLFLTLPLIIKLLKNTEPLETITVIGFHWIFNAVRLRSGNEILLNFLFCWLCRLFFLNNLHGNDVLY